MKTGLSGTPSERTKAKGGCYYVQNYVDAEGKRKQASGATPKEAKASAEAKIKGTDTKKIRSPDTLTFEQFSKKFMEDSAVGRDGRLPLTHSSIKVYGSYLKRRILPRMGHLRIASITRSHIATLRDELIADAPARSTATKSLTVVKSVMTYAVECGLIPSSPAAGVHITTDWAEEEDLKEARVPSLSHMRCIEEAARECYHSENKGIWRAYRRNYPFFLILRTLGLRSSECIGLQWEDFSPDLSKVSVRRMVSPPLKGVPEEDRVQRTKSKNGRRTIPVPLQVSSILKTWREECPRTKAGWVFPVRRGTPVSYYNMRSKFWIPLIKRAGLEDEGYGMHCMRHFFASTLIRKGKAKEAQTFLGHHSAAFTMDQYGHLFPDDDLAMDVVRDTVLGGMEV